MVVAAKSRPSALRAGLLARIAVSQPIIAAPVSSHQSGHESRRRCRSAPRR